MLVTENCVLPSRQGPINILGRVTIIGSFLVAVLNVGDLKMAKIAANRAESCVLPSRQFDHRPI